MIRRSDAGHGSDRVNIVQSVRVLDHGLWNPRWSVHKFRDHKDRVYKAGREGVSIEELRRQFQDRFLGTLRFPGNLLLNEGINELWTLVAGTGAVKFDNTNANIGVGDSATAEVATQTGLQAATNKLYKAMDSGFPTFGSSQKGTWRSTFGASEANWVWNEIALSNTTLDTGKNLNRKVQAMGTKASPTVMIPTLEITIT